MLPPVFLGPGSARQRWLAACGERPSLRRWKNMRSSEKFRLLHDVAERVDALGNDYLTPYEQMDIDDVLAERKWSVEHVLPRSRTGDSARARSDPNGWIVATRVANSARGNLPLLLWDGEAPDHFAPPLEQRARLARKWLFVRATYGGLDRPSKAQLQNAQAIVDFVKTHPPDAVEQNVNRVYRDELGWANPLIENPSWLDDAEWVRTAFS